MTGGRDKAFDALVAKGLRALFDRAAGPAPTPARPSVGAVVRAARDHQQRARRDPAKPELSHTERDSRPKTRVCAH